MANGDPEKKGMGSMVMPGIMAVTLLAGGTGGATMMGDQNTLENRVQTLTDVVRGVMAEQAAEELRIMMEIRKVAEEAASRARRVRDDLQAELEKLEDKLHSMELTVARMGQNP